MTFKKVKALPKGRYERFGKVQQMVKEFEDSDVQVAEVIYNEKEYTSAYICSNVINKAAKAIGANVAAKTINGTSYIMKTINKVKV